MIILADYGNFEFQNFDHGCEVTKKKVRIQK